MIQFLRLAIFYFILSTYAIAAQPVITSNNGGDVANINVPEKTTPVTKVMADDADLDTLTYSITGGTDQGTFNIDPSTGVLGFTESQEFGSPGDTNKDNIYEVIVQVSDPSAESDIQTLNVIVTEAEARETKDFTITKISSQAFDWDLAIQKTGFRRISQDIDGKFELGSDTKCAGKESEFRILRVLTDVGKPKDVGEPKVADKAYYELHFQGKVSPCETGVSSGLVVEDVTYAINKSSLPEEHFRTNDLVFGAMVIPFKIRSGKEITGGGTLGGYVGIGNTDFIGTSVVTFGAGLTKVPVTDASNNTTEEDGFSLAMGWIFTSAEEDTGFAVQVGWDWVGKSKNWEHEGEPWLSFSFNIGIGG